MKTVALVLVHCPFVLSPTSNYLKLNANKMATTFKGPFTIGFKFKALPLTLTMRCLNSSFVCTALRGFVRSQVAITVSIAT